MQYRTIALGLLESNPMYPQLCGEKKALDTIYQLAEMLKESHEQHKEALAKANTRSSPQQIATEAMELAVADLEACLEAWFLPHPGTAATPETAATLPSA